MPRDGGPSADVRAVLLVLAGDANYTTQVAFTSAPTIGSILGRHERTVRRWLDELEALNAVPVTRPRGKSAHWHFLTPSTPRATDARGSVVHTPGAWDATPGARARGRVEGAVLTDTYAVQHAREDLLRAFE